MAEDQGVAAVGLALHARNIVADRIAFTLIVMVLTSHPHRSLAFVLDIFFMVEFPNQLAVPVYLSQVGLILIGEVRMTDAQTAHAVAAWQQFVGEAL